VKTLPFRAALAAVVVPLALVVGVASPSASAPLDEPVEPTAPVAPAALGIASYYPSGPQLNVPQADLVGWSLCYTDLYSDTGAPLFGAGGIIDELCPGDYLLLAGAPVGETTLTLLAAGPRADVLTDTGTDETTVTVSNGTGWYFNDSWSWGFVRAGDVPRKSSCDTSTESTNDERLCWHTEGQLLDNGFRLGSDTSLNEGDSHARYIYTAAGIVSPIDTEPELADTGVGLDAASAAGAAGLALLAGFAIVMTMSASRRRTTR